jgi:FixJ family two-component response regulator
VGRGTMIEISVPSGQLQPAILIEDDAQLAALWQKVAAKNGISLRHFSSPDEFTKHEKSVPSGAVIYLDLEFPGGMDPLPFGASLKERGFRVVLTTGHAPGKYRSLGWVDDVIGKEPPWG